MTPLRQRMLEDMQIRNFSQNTQESYLMCGATISVRARDNQGERRCRGATIMPSCVVVCKSSRRGVLSATGRGAT